MKKIFLLFLPFFFVTNSFAQEWTEPIIVSNISGENQLPDFCIDKEGVIHCIWVHVYNTDFSKIYYSRSDDDGLSWTTAENISLNTDKRLSKPHIVCDSDNNLHITYDYDTFNYLETLVYYKKFDGISWSDPSVVSENMPESHANKLLIDNNNRVYCFWYRSNNNGTTYYRYLENDIWSDYFIPYNNNDYLGFVNCAIGNNNNLHWIGAHYYEGQTAYDIKPIYFSYDRDNNLWSDFVEFGEYRAWHGFDIDLDNTQLPHLVWQEYTNDSPPLTDGTFYSFNNGSNWPTPELVVEDPIEQQIAMDENSKPNIFDVEKTEDGSMLVYYFKTQGAWEGYIIDESEWYGMNPLVHNHFKKLYVMYVKASIASTSEICFSKAGIVNNINHNKKHVLNFKIFPNPFSKHVRLSFRIDAKELTVLSIYNLQGKLVNTLTNEYRTAGVYEIIWNGKDQNGKEVKSGLYLVRLQSGRNVFTRSVEFIKK